MSQPTDPTRPSVPRDPGAPTPPPGRRVSDSRHTFPADAPAPPSAPPPSASSDRPAHPGQSVHAPDGQTSPLVPQIGSPDDGGSGGSAQNPYGAAGARYSSQTPPPAAGLATGAIPRVNPAQGPGQSSDHGSGLHSGHSSAADGRMGPGHSGPGHPEPGHSGPGHTGHDGSAPVTGPVPHAGPAAPAGGQPAGAQPTAGGEGQTAAFAGAPAHHSGQMPPGGPPPSAQRPRRRGPGWGALIAAAVAAAIVGGALGGGGAWLLSGDASPVASQPSQDSPGQSDRSISQSTETPDWAQIADQTTPGVAAIQVGVDGEVSGLGSGFVYDDQGHVITNNHVVAPADTEGGEVQVVMTDGSMIPAALVGRDAETDVAVLKLETVPEDLTPLPIGSSEDMFVGDPVMALGNPLGLADSVTTGIVSALDRPVSTQNIGDVSEQEVEMTITNAIQTDAAINPGNSGGPLVNGNGEVIGINSSTATLSDPSSSEAQSGSIGIGFAITIEQATNIADQLIQTGEAKHPFLGVTMVNSTVDAQGITRGSARVETVEDGSPAAAAGFEEGDEIIAMGEKPVNNGVSLQALVRSAPPGEPVEFTVIRDGQEQTLQASLSAQ